LRSPKSGGARQCKYPYGLYRQLKGKAGTAGKSAVFFCPKDITDVNIHLNNKTFVALGFIIQSQIRAQAERTGTLVSLQNVGSERESPLKKTIGMLVDALCERTSFIQIGT
jgi:hypothetical protein